MNNNIKKYLIFFLLFFIFLISSNLKAQTILDISEKDFVIGDDNAPVTIIEYASLSCSHCAEFHTETLPKILEEYVDKGLAKIVFRDFPLNYPALMGSMVLRCVSEDVRYQYQEALYELQSKWVFRDTAKTKQELYKIMQSGGMKKEDFDKCIENVDLENEILVGLMNAQEEFKIKSTPSFIINGEVSSAELPTGSGAGYRPYFCKNCGVYIYCKYNISYNYWS